MPADSATLAGKAQDLVQWILDQAPDGIGPLPSASNLADDYKSKPYANDAERVQGLTRVRTAVLLCTIGTAMEDVAKQAGVTLGGKAAMEVLEKVPGKVLIDINKRVGFRLLTKFGERGVLNLAKLVPLVGGAVGGTFDGATCYLVGQAADRAFRQTADTTGIDARIDTAVAALQARIDIRTRELEVRLTRRMVGVLLAGIAGTVATTVVILWLLG